MATREPKYSTSTVNKLGHKQKENGNPVNPRNFPEVDKVASKSVENHVRVEGKNFSDKIDYENVHSFDYSAESWQELANELLEEIGNQISREVENKRNNRLPHSSYWIGDRVVNISGIGHGQEDFAELSDDTRGYLVAEVREILEKGDQIYVEEGFEELVLPEFENHPNMHEINDHDILPELTDSDENPNKVKTTVLKNVAKGIGYASDIISNFTSNYNSHKEHAKEKISIKDAVKYSVKDPEMLSNLQRGMREIEFSEDFYEKLDAFKDNSPDVVAEMTEYGEILLQGRSEYMVDEAMRRSEPEEEIWLIVGAGHQPGMERYIEE